MNRDTVAITGANGVLGKALVKLLKQNDYEVLILHHDMEEIRKLLKEKQTHLFALVHCAFARSEDSEQLSKSLLFTKEVMALANELELPRVVNISSKSVYENNVGGNWNEAAPVHPKGSYALAKYAAEVIADASIINPSCKMTHIRLASLIGPGMEQRVVTKLIRKVIQGQDITITKGTQMFQYMDIRDAAGAIVALLNTDKKVWKTVYCVAPCVQISLQDIAKEVVETCAEEGYSPVDITVTGSGNCDGGYMESVLFYKDTKWKEKYSLKDCILDIISQISIEG